jgi:hypothetical protein
MHAAVKRGGKLILNPLRWGWSREVIDSNISALRRSGYSQTQAVAVPDLQCNTRRCACIHRFARRKAGHRGMGSKG